VLAATLSPSYGIYSGFENVEATAVAPGSEEYLDSEKYELRKRKLDGELLPLVARLNAIRREHAPFHRLDNLTFLETANDALIAYAKQDGGEAVIVCVNLDPHSTVEGWVQLPPELALPDRFDVRDLLTGETWSWTPGGNYVRLAPGERQAHILLVSDGVAG